MYSSLKLTMYTTVSGQHFNNSEKMHHCLAIGDFGMEKKVRIIMTFL